MCSLNSEEARSQNPGLKLCVSVAGPSLPENGNPLTLGPMTRSRPLARPSRAFGFAEFLSSVPNRLKSPKGARESEQTSSRDLEAATQPPSLKLRRDEARPHRQIRPNQSESNQIKPDLRATPIGVSRYEGEKSRNGTPRKIRGFKANQGKSRNEKREKSKGQNSGVRSRRKAASFAFGEGVEHRTRGACAPLCVSVSLWQRLGSLA